MPKIIITAVAAIIMIVAAGVGAMKFLQWGPFAPPPEAAASEQASGAKPPKPPRFISMDPLVVPVIQNDAVAAIIQIQVQLEIKEENEDEVRRLLPRLADAFLRDLNGYLPRLIRSDGQLDANKVRSRLFVIGERAIGKGLIDNVLIQSVMDQPSQQRN